MSLSGRNIGQHGDDTLSAPGKQRHNLIVVAGIKINVSVRQVHKGGNSREIAAGLLHSHNIFHFHGKFGNGLRLNGNTRSSRNIIENHRDFYGVSHQLKMCEKSLLSGLVLVVGNH